MYILIGADVVPTSSNYNLFQTRDTISLVGEQLTGILDRAEYRIFNLEVPLTDQKSPIVKHGPRLIAPTSAVAGYQALGTDLLSLSNNHIFDQGVKGLESTIHTLNHAGIAHVGAGENLAEACKPFVFSFAGKKIGVYACAEHEFSIAGETSPGANPFDPLWSLDHIESLKKNTDYVIVLYHGGKEHYRYPSPNLQKVCRRLVDKGADLVLCQHSHCIGCEEKYNTGTIVYGQGNFLFDHKNDECWKTGLLVKLDDSFLVSYIPLVQEGAGERLADEDQARQIMQDFQNRSQQITKEGFIERTYSEFADSFYTYYLRALSGRQSVFFRLWTKLSKGIDRHFAKKYGVTEKVRIVNYVDCEAHRELLLQAIKKPIQGENDDQN